MGACVGKAGDAFNKVKEGNLGGAMGDGKECFELG